MADKEASSPPSFGLLTRTLVESPVFKSIIPARIRHASKNDVVFVRDRSILVKEIRKEGPLSEHARIDDVAIKNDFDSSIRAARILGLPRVEEASEPIPKGIDAIIKQEPTGSPKPSREPALEPELSPHILALTLESMKLVFLCAFHQGEEVHFLSTYRHLPHARTHSEQLGEHLAVDPASRAMAVAANEGCFYFYALKTMDELRRATESADGLQNAQIDPIRGVKILRCVVRKMLIEHRRRVFESTG